MADLQDLAKKKEQLAEIEGQIEAKEQDFARSMTALREQRESLRREYADALRQELASVGGADGAGRATGSQQRASRGSAPKPDPAAILAAIEKAQTPISVERIRELAGVPKGVSSNSMSTALKALVDGGQVVREGQRRGTRYRIA